MTLIKYSLSVHQEYQDHHSEEEDGDLYEKIGNTERDEKSAGGVDKRRRETISSFNCGLNDVIVLTRFSISGYNYNHFKCLTCSIQAECHTLIQLGRRRRPEEGSNQADEVPHETPHAAVCQGERIHPG